MHEDRVRAQVNEKTRAAYKKAVKAMRTKPNLGTLKTAFSAIDTAAKKHVIHKNKAARLKSHLSHLTAKTAVLKTAAP
ncbi:MAG: 30S ribosomal protein S20 [Candidatus Gottesmanbacteria bacterium GW2011_GWA1_43_11]|uniref:Small ribosomal subunit protein bS20 n=1 Tax=Candidatus Gottesmanbacteria bacterium GW2011_GWA1_43_11 TaxID=1618436 RepID=A0A0G1EN19_9BACT|nr:MAG: 30S ribosomal protein S20 [Candidatus Gottesmanbacteria bacterium GW2011_GWA1_43_11]